MSTPSMFHKKLQTFVEEHGGFAKAGEKAKLSGSYLWRLLNDETRTPPEKLLKRLRLQREVKVIYRETD
jgi:hypothetical protein